MNCVCWSVTFDREDLPMTRFIYETKQAEGREASGKN